MNNQRKLRVFLCHASQDKPKVRELYKRLSSEGWIDPWLDEEKLHPGQNWDMEIEKAVEATEVVIVFLSKNSVTKEGYVQRELRFVLRIADFKPQETIFVIPVRLEDCAVPRCLSPWQYLDYFLEDHGEKAYQRLLHSLRMCASKSDIETIKLGSPLFQSFLSDFVEAYSTVKNKDQYKDKDSCRVPLDDVKKELPDKYFKYPYLFSMLLDVALNEFGSSLRISDDTQEIRYIEIDRTLILFVRE